MFLELAEILYLGVWALIGSILGFFAFGYDHNKTPISNLYRCLLSVGIGIFIAFPLCTYLEEAKYFSKNLNIMLGGLGAFGLPEFIVKWWPKIIQTAATKVVDNSLTNGIKYQSDHKNDKDGLG